MNLQQQEQFYQMMTRLRTSKAASGIKKEDATETETIMTEGLIVRKPIASASRKKGPEVIDLQEYARSVNRSPKAASMSVDVAAVGINKVKAINDFIRSNGRVF